MKNRLKWLDVAKGIAIIGVIVGHSYDGFITRFIYSFHMPLFFILSGYTIKELPIENIWDATKKDLKRLILPCLYVRAIIVLVDFICGSNNIIRSVYKGINSLLWGNHVTTTFLGIKVYEVGFIWFFIVIFWAKLLYRILSVKIKSGYMIIVAIFCFIIGNILSSQRLLPQGIDLILYAIFMLEIGHLMNRNANIIFDLRYVCPISLISFIIWMLVLNMGGEIFDINLRWFGGSKFILYILATICASVCVIYLSVAIEDLKISRALMFLGNNSLTLLCIHWIEFYTTTLKLEWLKMLDTTPKAMICRLLVDIAVLLIFNYAKETVKKIAVLNHKNER